MFVIDVFASADEVAQSIDEIVVEGDPRNIPTRSNIGSVSTVDQDDIAHIRPRHPHELFARIAGIWVVENSGQEHLTGLRSGVLAGPGACGSYLLLEDNIPVRPIGMCNVNGLFELNFEQADRIEVLRGPASAIYGGNALRGVINVRPFIGSELTRTLSLEIGAHHYRQLRGVWNDHALKTKLHLTDTNGFREDTGYKQHKLNIGWNSKVGAWDAQHTLSLISLYQDTGGYVLGYQSYKDPNIRVTNPNPEAYRDAQSIRFQSQLSKANQWYIYPYVRKSRMNFLQHFLPGRPREENSQVSFGAMFFRNLHLDYAKLHVGAHLDWMDASIIQQQKNPTTGSNFLRETRPKGTHYDFDVQGTTYAIFQGASVYWLDRHEFEESVRIELTRYKYDNRQLDGNTRDDGSSCGFGGCLYTRPSDRSNSFTNVAAQLGYKFLPHKRAEYWILTSIGYRPPQITELYRLQSGQTTANLNSEKTQAVEFGWRSSWEVVETSIAIYLIHSSNLIFRDAQGFNVSDGATDSLGLEIELQWQVNDSNELSLAASISNNRYDFTRNLARGELILAGNFVDTAPRVLTHARWTTSLGTAGYGEVEINRIGSHYLDGANSARYGGHTVVNLRAEFELNRQWSMFARILNAFDQYYANRADFAFRNYRYFPADLRQIFVGMQRTFS